MGYARAAGAERADAIRGENLPTEPELTRLVWTFYDRVRQDPELGPIFERRIGSRWDAHLERMVDFWSSVLLGSGRFRGDPVAVHRGIGELAPRHFDRWLDLFDDVLREFFVPSLAADLHARACRMRVALESALPPRNPPDAGASTT